MFRKHAYCAAQNKLPNEFITNVDTITLLNDDKLKYDENVFFGGKFELAKNVFITRVSSVRQNCVRQWV